MLVPQDPRYYDLTSRLAEVGITLEDLAVWLTLKSMHPFTQLLSQQRIEDPLTQEMISKYGSDIPLYEVGQHYFKVHVGTLYTFCKYLRLRPITSYQGAAENLQKMTKPYSLPSGSRNFEIVERKKLWSLADKQSVKRETDRLEMVGLILDNDYSILKDNS